MPATNVPAPGDRLLVVEDQPRCAELLVEVLRSQGFAVEVATDGESALAAIARQPPDLVLLDVGLPGMDGIEVCRRIKRNAQTRCTPVVLLTGGGRDKRIAGIEADADEFLSKPFDREELKARVRSLVRLKRYTDELESVESIIMSLALTVEARDAYTEGHCERLATYSETLGAAIGLPEDDLAALRRGGYLHDVGKIGIPDAILLKHDRLTPQEYEIMKRHPVIGEKLCDGLRSLAPVRQIIRHHHERLDGSGYPDGLKGDAIPLLAQIVAIADAYDAMTTSRPYRRALPLAKACDELRTDAANGLMDGALVAAFVSLVERGWLAA